MIAFAGRLTMILPRWPGWLSTAMTTIRVCSGAGLSLRCGRLARFLSGNPLNGLAIDQGITVNGMQTLRQGLADLTAGAVLVLDDFHVIDHPEILESVAVLLRHESPLRLLLITRSDPVLPLHRLRVDGGLLEIRSADLAFDRPEAEEFFRLNGSTLSAPDVELLLDRTEGWAAGLRLAAMHLTSDSTGRAAEFAGDNRAVTEYLLADVFASQPGEMRNFLLRTSISDRICAELANCPHRQRRWTARPGRPRAGQHLHHLARIASSLVSLPPVVAGHLDASTPARGANSRPRTAWPSGSAGLLTMRAPVQAMRHAANAQDWRPDGRIVRDHCWPEDPLGRPVGNQ